MQLRSVSGAPWHVAADVAQKLSLFQALPDLIGKAENAQDPRIRHRALAVTLDLTAQLGRRARTNTDRSRFQPSVVERLQRSIETIEFHRRTELIDAFFCLKPEEI